MSPWGALSSLSVKLLHAVYILPFLQVLETAAALNLSVLLLACPQLRLDVLGHPFSDALVLGRASFAVAW